MIFKPYPKYTSCAIQWFNEIPQSWKQVRVEQYLIKKDENIGDLWSSTQLLSLTQKGIIEKDINEGKGKTHSDYSTYQAIDIGDLVFCLFDIDETPRTVGLSTKKGMITSAYTAFKSKENINTQYVYYFFESLDDAKALKPYYKGLRKTVRPPEFLKIHVPFPPKVEQVAISQFLDTETARIDTLIAKQEKLIELLEEQRKSIISHAVTKGLNPDAPMKDSGVEWLGEVPEHWEAASIKYLCKIDTGNKDTVDALDDGLYPFFVRSKKIETINEYAFDGEAILTAGDGAGVGKIYHYINGKFNYHQRVYKMSHFTKASGKFFFFYFSSLFEKVALDGGAKSTVDSLRKSHFDKFIMAIPTSYEQQKIVEYIEQQANKIDFLIEKQNQLIEKLKEYRTSIISHAVTGKINVREFGA